jgi:hypothetical protein
MALLEAPWKPGTLQLFYARTWIVMFEMERREHGEL